MAIYIKPVDISSFSEIEELHKMIFHFYAEYDINHPISSETINNTIKHLKTYPENGSIQCIYNQNNILVGYSILIKYWSNEYHGYILFIDELYIKPAHRDQGLGSNFIKLIETGSKDIQALALEVSPLNNKASDLYEKIGFIKNKNSTLIKILRK